MWPSSGKFLGFRCVTLAKFIRSFSFRHDLQDLFALHRLIQPLVLQSDDVTNGARSLVLHWKLWVAQEWMDYISTR